MCRGVQLDVLSGKALPAAGQATVVSLGGLTASTQLQASAAAGAADLGGALPIVQACAGCCPVTLQPWVAA